RSDSGAARVRHGSAATAGSARTDSSPSPSASSCTSSTGRRRRTRRSASRPWPPERYGSALRFHSGALAFIAGAFLVERLAEALAFRRTPFNFLNLALPLIDRHGVGLIGRAGAGRRQDGQADQRCGAKAHHAPTANTRHAATKTTAISEAGRKIFQPRRISWS